MSEIARNVQSLGIASSLYYASRSTGVDPVTGLANTIGETITPVYNEAKAAVSETASLLKLVSIPIGLFFLAKILD